MQPLKEEMIVQDHVAELHKKVRYKLPHSVLYNEWRMKKLDGLVDWKEREHWTVLDNGCGIAHFSEWIRVRHPKDVEVFGTDLSFEMLRHARQILNGSACQADSQSLPFKEGAFDVVFANSLLHHLPSPELGLKEIHRVLKQGGLLCLVDPNHAVLASLVRGIFQKKDHFSEVHKDFDLNGFSALVGERFDIESREYFGYIAYPLLGFPDVLNVLRLVRFPEAFSRFLIKIDEGLACIPLVRGQGFGFMIKARKK